MGSTRYAAAGLAVLIASQCAAPVASAQTPSTCARSDFEAIVDSAGEALRTLTQKNSPIFQAKLRQLKEKRGWTTDQFMVEGARFVKDDKINVFDDQAGDLLSRINGGNDNATGTPATADCRQLATMKADLSALVTIQTAKWTYMFTAIDAELAH